MPNQPKTPNRVIRVPDELWNSAQETASRRQETVADVVRASLRRYVKRHEVRE